MSDVESHPTPHESTKVSKSIRFYYRHREELLEKQRQRYRESALFKERQAKKEETKKRKEEEKKQKEEKKRERRQQKAIENAVRLGIERNK